MNQKIDAKTLAFIRTLEDFDLLMLLSEINDQGWVVAEKTLEMIKRTNEVSGGLDE